MKSVGCQWHKCFSRIVTREKRECHLKRTNKTSRIMHPFIRRNCCLNERATVDLPRLIFSSKRKIPTHILGILWKFYKKVASFHS